ncbi:MAG TPA: hypothetical protein VMM76_01670 [Pirellulaceae bacterium]|nr:hypothetical protein [Pirellulaceae bacterium]
MMRTIVYTMILFCCGAGVAWGQKGADHHFHHRHLDPPRAAIVDSVPVRQVRVPIDRSPNNRIDELERRIAELEEQLKMTLEALNKTLLQIQQQRANNPGS